MKLNNHHLTYCTNIHPGEHWNEVFTNLQKYIPALKTQLGWDKPFGIGLRLADIATRELSEQDKLPNFKRWLEEHNLYVFTLNGFPYGGFHFSAVKDKVYAPDWTTPERVEYTLRLAKILAPLLPDRVEGSISTLPLSYKPWFKNKSDLPSVMVNVTQNLMQVVAELVHIKETTGKILHLGLEPEPDGLVENTAEVIQYFQEYLIPVGSSYLATNLGISKNYAKTLVLEHIGICYDTCHFAVEYENPVSALKQFQIHGIKISKIQISAALQVKLSNNIEQRNILKQKLQPFAESTYLHQAIGHKANGEMIHYSDLDAALVDFYGAEEWRIHFHVPIFIRNFEGLQSTQDDIISTLKLLKNENFCNHLEIETYTWEVLPSNMKLDILASIQREYEWVLQFLQV
jgi:hypothetical protein